MGSPGTVGDPQPGALVALLDVLLDLDGLVVGAVGSSPAARGERLRLALRDEHTHDAAFLILSLNGGRHQYETENDEHDASHD